MRKFLTHFLLVILFAGIILSTVACGGGGSEKPGQITGVVRWLDPTPAGSIGLKDVTVNIWNDDDAKVAYGVTDDKGKFSITNVPVGTYIVTAHAPAGVAEEIEKRWMKTGVKVIADRETPLEFVYQNAIGDELPEKYLK